MNHNEKMKIANNYLSGVCGLSWDELADINSLHDCEDKEEIIEYCQERLEEAGFPSDLI